MSNKSSVKSFSETLVAGSEEDFDIICDLCHTENKRVEADGYCVDCAEYLCKECRRYHKKTSATRNHGIQDNLKTSKAKTGGKRPPKSSKTTDPLTDRCENHPQEMIKYYCNLHKQLGCSVCLSLHHRTCEDVSYIPDVSYGTSGSEELKNIQAELMRLLAGLECSNSRLVWCQGVAEESYYQVLTDVKQFRKNINQLLDDLEAELYKEASRRRRELVDSLRSQKTKCIELLEQISKMNLDMDRKEKLNFNNQLFTIMKSASENIQSFENEAGDISQEVGKRLVFKPNETLGALSASVSSLGTLSLVGKPEDINAEYLYHINVKSDSDTEDCVINSMTVLPDGRLAVTDYGNKAVKLIDINHRNISLKVTLVSGPRCITMIGNDQLAVLLHDTNRIQFLSISPKLSVKHTVELPGRYNGLAYNEGRLILTCHNPSRSVHICDISGNLLQQIDTDYRGRKLYGNCITGSPDKNTIYITDLKTGKIILLNKAGVVLTSYANDRFQRLEGIDVDDYGYIYVCSMDNHTVHQLSPNGTLIKIILQKKDGIVFPMSLKQSTGKLYISSFSADPSIGNNINVYRLD